MARKGRVGAYRKEDRVELPPELQRRLVDAAAARYGDCQKLAKALGIPKSSVHYYRIARLTMPTSLLERMLDAAGDVELEERVREQAKTKDRTWANAYACEVYRNQCRQRVNLPTLEELRRDDGLRRNAVSIISYVMAEGSIWIRDDKWGEGVVNITFADHEHDLYNHFRSLCLDVFRYDIGPPQRPGNDTRAIRGFIYSRFVAEWLVSNGVVTGEKSAQEMHMPHWVAHSDDSLTWVAAVQPWCDGEGCVIVDYSPTGAHSFVMTQSRHTVLTTDVIPGSFRTVSQMTATKGRLRQTRIGGLSGLEYCRNRARSEILDDVSTLVRRLGLAPRVDVVRLALKQDGFWSCVWGMSFSSDDTAKLLRLGLVTQERKRRGLEL